MNTDKQEQRFLTVPEAAVALRLAPSTVYRLTRAGVVESVKVGGSVRIPARALEPEPREAA
jgi:excisionase family DNA binding protein